MFCRCGQQIPEKRLELGFKECVKCSTVEPVGCVDVVYHKTGNTIEITDRATAERMRKLSRRNSHGILAGMKPGPKSAPYRPSGKINGQRLLDRAVIANPEQFEKDGAQALEIAEYEGVDTAVKWLQKRVEDLWLTPVQMGKIRQILLALQPKPSPPSPTKKSWYSKYEPPTEKPEVDEEISDAFKYWKR